MDEYVTIPLYQTEQVHRAKVLMELNGLVLHKNFVDMGSVSKEGERTIIIKERPGYIVTHKRTGGSVLPGRGRFRLKKDAIAYLEAIAGLNNWPEIKDRSDITRGIYEAVCRVKERFNNWVY